MKFQVIFAKILIKMTHPAPSESLTNGQLAILSLLAEPLSEAELAELHLIITRFRYERLQRLLDDEWQKRGYDDETTAKWLAERMRTPYLAARKAQAEG